MKKTKKVGRPKGSKTDAAGIARMRAAAAKYVAWVSKHKETIDRAKAMVPLMHRQTIQKELREYIAKTDVTEGFVFYLYEKFEQQRGTR